MDKLTSISLFFLSAGILTSVSILSAYQILFTVPLVYFSYHAFKDKRCQIPLSAKFLLAFTLVAFLGLVVNYDIIPKPSKNFGKLKYFLFGIGGIFVLRHWLQEVSDRTKTILINTFFVSIIASASYAVWYFITYDGRARGLTDTMRYGYGSAMILLMLLSAILHQNKINSWFNWKLALPVFIIGFIGMYLTYTRGALLGFICGLPFVLYYFNRKLGLIFGGIATMGVLFLIGIYLLGDGKYESRFLTNKNNRSDVMRRSQWQAAIIATQEKPLLGWGLSNFHTQVKRIKSDHDLGAKWYDDAHSHNLFLEIASGTGIIGLLFFLGWLFTWAFEIFKAGGLLRALLIPFGVAFVVSSQFEVTFDANNASMIFFLYALSFQKT